MGPNKSLMKFVGNTDFYQFVVVALKWTFILLNLIRINNKIQHAPSSAGMGQCFVAFFFFFSLRYCCNMILSQWSTQRWLIRWALCVPLSPEGVMSSAKSAAHERKSAMTPTQRDSVPAKSPVSGGDPVASHSPFDPHHRPVVPGEVYRAHLPPHLDPTLAFHRVLDPGTVFPPWTNKQNNNSLNWRKQIRLSHS